MDSNWIAYWNQDSAMTGDLWPAQSDFFVRQIQKILSFGPDDLLLDIGCGHGHGIAALAQSVKEAHGADTSAYCVRQAAARFAGRGNLHFHQLPPENYLALETLPVRGLTRIICVSVVQYYKCIDELQTLIRNANNIAAPGCHMLLADLLVDYSLCKDIAGVLLGGLLSGTFTAKLQEVFSGHHGSYKKTRKQNPLLMPSYEELRRIAREENALLRFIPRNLTGNCFRAHALFELPGNGGGTCLNPG